MERTTEASQYFFGILAFAMIAGDLAVDTEADSDEVLRHLGEVSTRTGFDDFTVLNAPTYLVQFQLTRQLIQDNTALLTGIAVLLMICVGLANGIIGAHVARRRWRIQKIEHLLGVSSRVTLTRIITVTAVEYACLLIAFALLLLSVPQMNLAALAPVALIAVACLVIDSALQALLRTNNIRRHLLEGEES